MDDKCVDRGWVGVSTDGSVDKVSRGEKIDGVVWVQGTSGSVAGLDWQEALPWLLPLLCSWRCFVALSCLLSHSHYFLGHQECPQCAQQRGGQCTE